MIFPVFGMVILAVTLGIFLVVARVRSVTSGAVKIKYYRAMKGQDAPETIEKLSRAFSNQFEIPVLFYTASILFISLRIQSDVALVLSWIFFFSRVCHAIIHVTYNNVVHRMMVFLAGVVAIVALWLTLMMAMV